MAYVQTYQAPVLALVEEVQDQDRPGLLHQPLCLERGLRVHVLSRAVGAEKVQYATLDLDLHELRALCGDEQCPLRTCEIQPQCLT